MMWAKTEGEVTMGGHYEGWKVIGYWGMRRGRVDGVNGCHQRNCRLRTEGRIRRRRGAWSSQSVACGRFGRVTGLVTHTIHIPTLVFEPGRFQSVPIPFHPRRNRYIRFRICFLSSTSTRPNFFTDMKNFKKSLVFAPFLSLILLSPPSPASWKRLRFVKKQTPSTVFDPILGFLFLHIITPSAFPLWSAFPTE